MPQNLLIVHPYDKSTGFLERIKNHLQLNVVGCQYFNIKPNKQSHDTCLATIETFPNRGLILFMGHGKSDCLCGAKGDFYGSLENDLIVLEEPEKYYYNENFINAQNWNVYNEKKVICFSCNSNGNIGRETVSAGAKVFLGFGSLPTSIDELREQGEIGKVGLSLAAVERAFKSEIVDVIKKSMRIAISKNYSFIQLIDLIQFITNQRISKYLVDLKGIKERKHIANLLYTFKTEIIIYGNKHEKLID